MDLNVVGYQSHLLQRCDPACGHEGFFRLSPVYALRISIAMLLIVQHLQLVNQWLNFTFYVLTLSAIRKPEYTPVI